MTGVTRNSEFFYRSQAHTTVMSPFESMTMKTNSRQHLRQSSMRNVSTAAAQRKKSAKGRTAPTIAQFLREKEQKETDEYYSSLKTVKIDYPRVIRSGTFGDDIEEIRLQLMKSRIDPKNFDLFLQSSFGGYLLEGINDEEKVEKQGITTLSEFIHKQNTYRKAVMRAKFDACVKENPIMRRTKRPETSNPSSKPTQTKKEFYLEHL